MTCREAQSLVIPFIHYIGMKERLPVAGVLREEMDDAAAEEFLEHIDGCAGCREEFEIYYTVEAGIRQLDEDIGSSNIKGDMEEDLRLSRQRLYGLRILSAVRYAADTLAALGVTAMLILQLRLWLQGGIF